MGKKTKTDTNLPCINWVGMGHGPDKFPDDDVAGAANYCRNPDNSPYNWCYTAPDPWRMWYRCAISSCDCPNGRFGVNCRSECHCSDEGNTCSPRTGVCQHGCNSDFKGTTCQECADRRFGIYCDKPCRCLLQHEVCNKTTGYCASGCAAGYTGKDCQKECVVGRYGQNCEGFCSDNCNQPRICGCVCKAGYHGSPACHKECVQGRYGLNCQGFCSDQYIQPGICDRFSGGCDCKVGYQPPTCHNACVKGSFGKNCVGSCRCQNTSEVCDKTDGRCAESGCAAGWHGPGCQTVCDGGRYGPNCIDTCSSHCINPFTCNKTSGICDCQDGYQQPTCHHVCKNGTFGRNCLELCNCRDRSEACHPVTGICAKSGEYRRDLVQIVAWSIAGILYMCDLVLLLLICRQNRIRRSETNAKQGRRVKSNCELKADSTIAGYANVNFRDKQAQAYNIKQDQNIEMSSGLRDFVERSPRIQETLIIGHHNDSTERSYNMHEVLNMEHQTDCNQPNMHEILNMEHQNDCAEQSLQMYEELNMEYQNCTEILPNNYEELTMGNQIDCTATSPNLYEDLNMEGQEDRTETTPTMYQELYTEHQDARTDTSLA